MYQLKEIEYPMIYMSGVPDHTKVAVYLQKEDKHKMITIDIETSLKEFLYRLNNACNKQN